MVNQEKIDDIIERAMLAAAGFQQFTQEQTDILQESQKLPVHSDRYFDTSLDEAQLIKEYTNIH